MKTNRIIATLLGFILLFSAAAVSAETTEYALSDSTKVRLLGRGEFITAESRTFNWPNAGFEFEFSGTSAEVYVDAAQPIDSTEYNMVYFNAAVLDENDEVISVNRMALKSGWNTIYASSAADKVKIMLVRSSEACRGTIRMSKIRTDAAPSAAAPRQKQIEFIGDSYTAGYGNSPELSEATYYCAQNTDNWNSYTGFVARHYKSDNTVIAYQGKGVCVNVGGDSTETMSQQFNYSDIVVPSKNMSTRETWNFMKYRPQVVVVWLGTNDNAGMSKAGIENPTQYFQDNYVKLLENIRAKYPFASIICCSRTNWGYPEQVTAAVEQMGGEAKRFYNLRLTSFKASSFGHPNVEEDKAIADELIAKIDSIRDVWHTVDIGSDETVSIIANYNTGVINVFGKTGEPGDQVAMYVLHPGETEFSADAVAYIDQCETDNTGDYSFEFTVKKLTGEYTLAMNSCALNNKQTRNFSFMNYIPEIAVSKGGISVTGMEQLAAGDLLDVKLSGFKPDDEISASIFVAQYSGSCLKAVNIVDGSRDSSIAGNEITLSQQVAEDVDKIKVIYMNSLNYSSLCASYDIE